MIKAKAKNGDIILGLSDENVEKLKQGLPIAFPLSEVLPEIEGRMIILHGETKEKILEMLSGKSEKDES